MTLNHRSERSDDARTVGYPKTGAGVPVRVRIIPYAVNSVITFNNPAAKRRVCVKEGIDQAKRLPPLGIGEHNKGSPERCCRTGAFLNQRSAVEYNSITRRPCCCRGHIRDTSP